MSGGYPVAAGPPAYAAPTPLRQLTLAETEDAAKINEVPAQYVILADTSASMRSRNRYAELRTALRRFLSALSPSDHLTVITFDSKARKVYDSVVGSSPDAVMKHVPATANGKSTDIGAAIAESVQVLRSAKLSIATVVLITDGEHEPPTGSKYPYTQGYAWDQLRASAAKLPEQSIQAYALPLTGSTGAGLLGTVYRGRTTNLSTAAIGQITSRLDQPKAAVRVAKLRSLIAGDMTKGVSVQWPSDLHSLGSGTNHLALTLHATTSHLPVVVSGLQVTTTNGPVTASVDGDRVITVNPGKTVKVPITVTWAAGPRTYHYRTPASVDYGISLTATIQSPWSAAAHQIGLTFAPKVDDAALSTSAETNLGRPGMWILIWTILGLVMIAVLAGLYRYPRLSGTLVITTPPDASEEPFSLRGRGRFTTIVPTDASIGRLRVHGSRAPRSRIVKVRGGARPLSRSMPLTLPLDEIRMERSVGFVWSRADVIPPGLVTVDASPITPAPRPEAHDRFSGPAATDPQFVASTARSETSDSITGGLGAGPLPPLAPRRPFDRWSDTDSTIGDDGARLD